MSETTANHRIIGNLTKDLAVRGRTAALVLSRGTQTAWATEQPRSKPERNRSLSNFLVEKSGTTERDAKTADSVNPLEGI